MIAEKLVLGLLSLKEILSSARGACRIPMKASRNLLHNIYLSYLPQIIEHEPEYISKDNRCSRERNFRSNIGSGNQKFLKNSNQFIIN